MCIYSVSLTKCIIQIIYIVTMFSTRAAATAVEICSAITLGNKLFA